MRKFLVSAVVFTVAFTSAASAEIGDLLGAIGDGKKLIDAASQAGTRTAESQLNSGGNRIGNVDFHSKSEVGKVTAIASLVEIGSGTVTKSRIGNLNAKLSATVGDITAIASGVRVASFSIYNSKLGDVNLDLKVQAGDITAIASYVGLADVTINNTTAGNVNVVSHVNVGDITAIASIVRIGSLGL